MVLSRLQLISKAPKPLSSPADRYSSSETREIRTSNVWNDHKDLQKPYYERKKPHWHNFKVSQINATVLYHGRPHTEQKTPDHSTDFSAKLREYLHENDPRTIQPTVGHKDETL